MPLVYLAPKIVQIVTIAFTVLAALIAARVFTRLLESYLANKNSRFSRALVKPWGNGGSNIRSTALVESSRTFFVALFSRVGLLPRRALPISTDSTSDDATNPQSKWDSQIRKAVPLLLGIGLILMPYFGDPVVYPAAYSFIILAVFIGLYRGELALGPKRVWIPLTLVTIAGLIFAKPPVGLLLVWMLGIYLVSSKFGGEITRYFGIVAAFHCVGLIVYTGLNGFDGKTGGLLSPINYNITPAVISISFLLWQSKYKWLLSPLVIAALFFTGADEVLVAVGAFSLALLIRRDWSKKLLLPVAALVITVAVCTPLGITERVWGYTPIRIQAQLESIQDPTDSNLKVASGQRWAIYQHAFERLKITGNGYYPFDDRPITVHNVPLRVAFELGIPAALAWLAAFIFALIKSRAKYAIIVMGALCLVDHFFWTQIPAYYWAGLGISLAASTGSDLIFKKIPAKVPEINGCHEAPSPSPVSLVT